MSTPTSTKRALETDPSLEGSSQSASSSNSPPPATKALRLTRVAKPPLYCSLPPTCNPPRNEPTALSNVTELESHYAKFHAHVCEDRACAAVFPSARLLELHQTECHDPISLLRKERGERIFSCHLEVCPRKFLTPKKRRLHLIQAHGFPKEYFFAVTNKGVGGLLKKWGEGASMIRGAWKARDVKDQIDEGMEAENTEDSDEDQDSMDEEVLSTGTVKDSAMGSSGHLRQTPKRENNDAAATSLENLASSMGSLSLVPRNIRFGRGVKGAKIVREARRNGRGTNNLQEQHATRGSQNDKSPDETVSRMDAESDSGLTDNDVSINIDGALEALKSEVPSNIPAKAHLGNGTTSQAHVLVTGRRARAGGRGGRGCGRGRGRGRS